MSPKLRYPLDIKAPLIKATVTKRLSTVVDIPRSGGLWKKHRLAKLSSTSPASAKTAMEHLAYYFLQEFEYDFLQFVAEDCKNQHDRFYLLLQEGLDSRGRIEAAVGAVSFRWRGMTPIDDRCDTTLEVLPSRLACQWLWIHPYLRRKGALTACWDYFRQEHGDFECERPLSKAMSQFLEKRGECAWHGRNCSCVKNNKAA